MFSAVRASTASRRRESNIRAAGRSQPTPPLDLDLGPLVVQTPAQCDRGRLVQETIRLLGAPRLRLDPADLHQAVDHHPLVRGRLPRLLEGLPGALVVVLRDVGVPQLLQDLHTQAVVVPAPVAGLQQQRDGRAIVAHRDVEFGHGQLGAGATPVGVRPRLPLQLLQRQLQLPHRPGQVATVGADQRSPHPPHVGSHDRITSPERLTERPLRRLGLIQRTALDPGLVHPAGGGHLGVARLGRPDRSFPVVVRSDRGFLKTHGGLCPEVPGSKDPARILLEQLVPLEVPQKLLDESVRLSMTAETDGRLRRVQILVEPHAEQRGQVLVDRLDRRRRQANRYRHQQRHREAADPHSGVGGHWGGRGILHPREIVAERTGAVQGGFVGALGYCTKRRRRVISVTCHGCA